jgi:hypothetical protein
MKASSCFGEGIFITFLVHLRPFFLWIRSSLWSWPRPDFGQVTLCASTYGASVEGSTTSCVSVVRIWVHENWIRVEFEDWGTQIFWSFFNHYWRIHFYPFFVCPCWPLPISSSTQCLFLGEAFQEGRSNGRTKSHRCAEIPWFGWKLAWRHSYHRYHIFIIHTIIMTMIIVFFLSLLYM